MPQKENNDFARQRLFEKWVVKDTWLMDEEAAPLLLGLDPENVPQQATLESLLGRMQAAVKDNSLPARPVQQGEKSVRVTPVEAYQWARRNNYTMPIELVNLMEFVMKTLGPSPSSVAENIETRGITVTASTDAERILGACVSILVNFPEQCRGRSGKIRLERVLSLLDQHSLVLFNGDIPQLSATAIRDVVNNWIMKIKH